MRPEGADDLGTAEPRVRRRQRWWLPLSLLLAAAAFLAARGWFARVTQPEAARLPGPVPVALAGQLDVDHSKSAIEIAEGVSSVIASLPREATNQENRAQQVPVEKTGWGLMHAGAFFQYLIQAPEAITEKLVLTCPELNPRQVKPSASCSAGLRQAIATMKPWLERCTELRCQATPDHVKNLAAQGRLQTPEDFALTDTDHVRIQELAQRAEQDWSRRHSADGRKPPDFTARAKEQLIESTTGKVVGYSDGNGHNYLVGKDHFRPPQTRYLQDYVAESYFCALLDWSLDAGLISDQEATAAVASLKAALGE